MIRTYNFYLVHEKEGIFLYTGKDKPIYNEKTQMFEAKNGEFIPSDILDSLKIAYDKHIKLGNCIKLKYSTKSIWNGI